MEVMFRKKKSVLNIILFIIFYSLLPMIGLVFYMSLGQRETNLQTTRIETNHIVNQIDLVEREIISKTETFLFTLAQFRTLKTQDKEGCSEVLPLILKKSNFFSNIFVADLQGNVYCSAVPLQGEVNISDRKYFNNTIINRRFSLGDYQIGRVTNKPVWVAGYPVFNDDDVLVGLVGASIDLKWLSNLLYQQKLPPGSVLKVFDDQGIILMSYPDEAEIGENKLDSHEISYVVSGNKSPAELIGSDNVERIYAFKELKSTASDEKKYILVGITKEFINKPIDEIFKRSLMLAVFITLVVILIVVVNWRLFIYPSLKN